MKKNVIVLIFVALSATLVLAAFSGSMAGNSEEILVYGKCDMCKSRIENAVKPIDGIESVKWNKKSMKLEVDYNKLKTTTMQIQTAVAMAGHDTEMFSANDKKYAELPGCCKYQRDENRKKVDHGKTNSGYNMETPANSGCDHNISESLGSCCEK